MNKYHLLLIALALGRLSFGQILPPKEAHPLNVKQIHSGHSLTDPLFNSWPGQYRYLVSTILDGTFDNLGKSTIPGSSMKYRWDNAPDFGQPDARHDIANWELLSITERVPLLYDGGSTQTWYLEALETQREQLSLFVNNAWTNGNNGDGAPTLLWTTWTNIDNSDGPWRQMLDTLGLEWEKMQDYANENRPNGAPPVYLIPGHKMMAKIYDDIQLGEVPGITEISQLFSDNIHLNDLGKYAVAMIHYACIYNTSPEGLTNVLQSDTTALNPTPALAAYLQKMIWEEVTSYNRTGIYPEVNSAHILKIDSGFRISPNPAHNIIYIGNVRQTTENNVEYTILNNLGQVVLTGNKRTINIRELPSGYYSIQVKNQFKKFIKN